MRILAKPPEEEAPRSIQASPLRKRIITAFAAFALVIFCVFSGMPAATAPTANLAGWMRIPSASPSLIFACGGACPGLCPCPSKLRVGSMLSL